MMNLLVAILVTASLTPALGQLEPAFEAHGGLERWRNQARVEYDVEIHRGQSVVREHRTLDLAAAVPLEKGGLSDQSVFRMPFLFADPALAIQAQESRPFRGHAYTVFKVDSDVLLYLGEKTNRLRLVGFLNPSEPHALVFDEWQEISGLLVPRTVRLQRWDGAALEEVEPTVLWRFSNVRFQQVPPEPSHVAGLREPGPGSQTPATTPP